MLGFEFEDCGEAFSVFNMSQSIAVFLFELFESRIDSYTNYTYILGLVGLSASILAYFFEFKANMQVLPMSI